MRDDGIQGLLRSADGDLASVDARPPRVTELERRHRNQVLRRSGVLALCLAAAATAHWSASVAGLRAGGAPLQDPKVAPLQLDEHLASLEEAVAKLRSLSVEPAPSPAVEATAIRGFRALRRSAASGDEGAVRSIAWIAERFPRTHGGRCARALLDGNSVEQEASSRPESQPKQPKNDR